MPVEYVKKHLSELMTYQETGQLLRELTEAWERIKQNYEPDLKLPEDFENTKKGLIREEQKLVADWRKLNPYRIDQKDIVWIRKAINSILRCFYQLPLVNAYGQWDKALIHMSMDIWELMS